MLFLFLMYFTELKAELSVVRTCGYRAFLIYLTYFSNIPLCPILGSTELGGEGFLSWGRVGFNLSHTSHGSVALSMWDLPKVLPYMYRVPYTACCGHPCRSRNWGLWTGCAPCYHLAFPWDLAWALQLGEAGTAALSSLSSFGVFDDSSFLILNFAIMTGFSRMSKQMRSMEIHTWLNQPGFPPPHLSFL